MSIYNICFYGAITKVLQNYISDSTHHLCFYEETVKIIAELLPDTNVPLLNNSSAVTTNLWHRRILSKLDQILLTH